MNLAFFIISALFFIIVQTIVLPSFPWFSHCFDLVTVNIIFLSLLYSHYGVLAAVILMGLIMDSISGCAFFYHVFSYAWIYLVIQLLKQFVFQKSVVFILVISMVSVIIQQALIFFSIFIIQGRASQTDFSMLLNQIIWALIVIPPSLWLLNLSRSQWHIAGHTLKKNIIRKYRD
ncbi:hypothetical protein [Desulfospira joergensenii]|uniref:hypothetical protein n=1 Tax=Desulfospira joergensenii TaxID=53329 RepID=UPI0003B6BF32|nr:hypothetical protein [Desulfospira joergensenii]